MAKRKKPDVETDEQYKIRQMLEKISNHATRSEKTTWNRKRKNIEDLVEEIKPLEDRMLDINIKMIPMLDKIKLLRNDMVASCIHPYDLLVYKGNHIECKFCNKKLSLPNGVKR